MNEYSNVTLIANKIMFLKKFFSSLAKKKVFLAFHRLVS